MVVNALLAFGLSARLSVGALPVTAGSQRRGDGTPLIPPDGLAGWSAQSGSTQCVRNDAETLIVTPCAGWLRTEPVFGDYTTTFQIRSQDGGARVLLGVLGLSARDGRPDALFGIPLLGATGAPSRSAARIEWLAVSEAARTQAMKPDGEWQTYAVTRNGQGIHVLLNGTQILSSGPIRSSDGWLGFKSDDGAFELRGMRLRHVMPAVGVGAGLGASVAGTMVEGAYRPGKGVALPKLVHDERPKYTASALGAHIQGAVLIECIVGIDGKVSMARVIRSLDDRFGLDEEALIAARRWGFQPGTRDGVAVPVWITIELTFSLKK